jgi:hypothetical protein
VQRDIALVYKTPLFKEKKKEQTSKNSRKLEKNKLSCAAIQRGGGQRGSLEIAACKSGCLFNVVPTGTFPSPDMLPLPSMSWGRKVKFVW